MQLPPLSLYIHIPWCERKCPYCDFNSHAASGPLPEKAYITALLSDLEADLPLAGERPVQSVFIGGGTPSLFSGKAITTLLNGLNARLSLVDDIEITMEANPGSAEAGRFSAYQRAGVNRLSLGGQSFDDRMLANLGRIHRAAAIRQAIAAARESGFRRFNLDLMFALPGQTVDQCLADLAEAVDLAVPHLSWYQLTLEPNTFFHRYPPSLPEDDVAAEMQDRGEALLRGAGYRRYEISAWCRDDRPARHNLNYWRFGDYIGIGAGAHGKLTQADGRILRTRKVIMPGHYLDRVGRCRAIIEPIPLDQLGLEFMMNVLRLESGVEEPLYTAVTGQPFSSIQGPLEQARAAGLMEPGRFQATPLGRRYLNDLLGLFMPD